MDEEPESEPRWEVVLRSYFFDASAIVKLVVPEPGSEKVRSIISNSGSVIHTSWVLIAEALGCLKRKWQVDKTLDDKQYTQAVFVLLHYIESDLRVVDIGTDHRGRISLLVFRQGILEGRTKHPKLDVADTLQFQAIKQGFLRVFAGESKTRLVSADRKLIRAARAEGIEVLPVNKD